MGIAAIGHVCFILLWCAWDWRRYTIQSHYTSFQNTSVISKLWYF